MGNEIKNIHSILIIDDDPDDFELVVEAMQEIDPKITVCYINSCLDVPKYRRKRFDLVLLDINMPQYDGFHWLRTIRKEADADMPVIMYTNSLSPAHLARACEEGANLYFSKPDNFPGLKKGLRALIGMDWSNPHTVTSQYCANGRLTPFAF